MQNKERGKTGSISYPVKSSSGNTDLSINKRWIATVRPPAIIPLQSTIRKTFTTLTWQTPIAPQLVASDPIGRKHLDTTVQQISNKINFQNSSPPLLVASLSLSSPLSPQTRSNLGLNHSNWFGSEISSPLNLGLNLECVKMEEVKRRIFLQFGFLLFIGCFASQLLPASSDPVRKSLRFLHVLPFVYLYLFWFGAKKDLN